MGYSPPSGYRLPKQAYRFGYDSKYLPARLGGMGALLPSINSAPLVIPAGLTFAGGAVAWWDALNSGPGVTNDGDVVTAPVNRIAESNAVLGTFTGSGNVIYQAPSNPAGWNSLVPFPSWKMLNAGLRATGSDILTIVNGIGKQWLYLIGYIPKLTAAPTQNLAGWSDSAQATFSTGAGISRVDNTSTVYSCYNAGTPVVDTQVTNQNAQVFELARVTPTQVQFGINKVRTAPVTYASGTNFNVNCFNLGMWAGNNTANPAGDMLVQYVQVFDYIKLIAATGGLNAVYAYNRSYYSGYELIGSLS